MSLRVPLQTYSDGDTKLSYGIVPWDSEIFGFKIAEAMDINVGDESCFTGFISKFEGHLKALNCKMLCVRIPFDDTELSWQLQGSGYTLVEETITPYIPDIRACDRDFSRYASYPLKKATSGDIPAIRRMAYAAFKYDRFHIDPRFDGTKASERYSYWVDNSFKSGDDVLYLAVGSEIAGFCILDIARNKAYIRLLGFDDAYRGKALGMSLFRATCQYMMDRGVREAETHMSLNNIAALNYYSRCGFRFKDPAFVLHRWL